MKDKFAGNEKRTDDKLKIEEKKKLTANVLGFGKKKNIKKGGNMK